MADGRTPSGAGEDGSTPPGPDPAGPAPAVRPFLVTAGRVAPSASGRTMPVETQVVATAEGLSGLDLLSFEQHDIVAACRRPQSIAEIAARLKLHLNVVRVLSEDLRVAGQLTVHVPDSGVTHDASVLRRVIDGLRAIPDSRGVLRDAD
ncbi:DUF742 domain-containing protein [Streptomyces resistomycificus]|uniref:Multi-component regulatory system-4 n=1 Tax=Streptomyces resistomycificus TaxID=67356 RepID=A0A0L8KX15_9ACTN|nr:DUF742 domain-containing protein [Streptomyces resistomycificus]KOG30481.1 multi-component regulatory system-4 [Streptomyces resistomycificus]KUO02267.1 multi-component regulatory system-4 [Streptomyces resistomycificus]